ncbi:hypothetical protein PFISCL1PPCAC_17167, partial [Pristionchus fissidentatus]
MRERRYSATRECEEMRGLVRNRVNLRRRLGELLPVLEETLAILGSALLKLVPRLLHGDASIRADHAQRGDRGHLEVRQVLPDLRVSKLQMQPVAVVVVEVLQQVVGLAIARHENNLQFLARLLHRVVPADELGRELATRRAPHGGEVEEGHLNKNGLGGVDDLSAALADLDTLEERSHCGRKGT